MLTTKADSVDARHRAYGALVKRSNPNPLLEAGAAGPIEPSAEPESIWDSMKEEFHTIPGRPAREGDVACSLPASAELVAALVRVLGIELRFEAERAGLRRLTAEQIRDHSHGLVSKAETLDYPTLEPVPGGLFCQAVFGPVRKYTCACGKHQASASAGGSVRPAGSRFNTRRSAASGSHTSSWRFRWSILCSATRSRPWRCRICARSCRSTTGALRAATSTITIAG